MNGDADRLLKQLVPCDQRGARSSRALGRDIWLQAITFMLNAAPIRATAPPTSPRPRTPSVRPAMSSPTTAAIRRFAATLLANEIAGAAQDKRPGQFDRRRRAVARMNDLNALLLPALRSIETFRLAVDAIRRSWANAR